MSKIGRNDPCPCGSGKKYKKCCIDRPLLEIVKRMPVLDYENIDYHRNSLLTYEEVNQKSTEEIIDKLLGFRIGLVPLTSQHQAGMKISHGLLHGYYGSVWYQQIKCLWSK